MNERRTLQDYIDGPYIPAVKNVAKIGQVIIDRRTRKIHEQGKLLDIRAKEITRLKKQIAELESQKGKFEWKF